MVSLRCTACKLDENYQLAEEENGDSPGFFDSNIPDTLASGAAHGYCLDSSAVVFPLSLLITEIPDARALEVVPAPLYEPQLPLLRPNLTHARPRQVDLAAISQCQHFEILCQVHSVADVGAQVGLIGFSETISVSPI
jgi:hypothetical protein